MSVKMSNCSRIVVPLRDLFLRILLFQGKQKLFNHTCLTARNRGSIHGRFSRVLLGRDSNNTVYAESGALHDVTDCLHRSNSLIVPIRLVFVISDGPTNRPTTDQRFEWLIESCARD